MPCPDVVSRLDSEPAGVAPVGVRLVRGAEGRAEGQALRERDGNGVRPAGGEHGPAQLDRLGQHRSGDRRRLRRQEDHAVRDRPLPHPPAMRSGLPAGQDRPRALPVLRQEGVQGPHELLRALLGGPGFRERRQCLLAPVRPVEQGGSGDEDLTRRPSAARGAEQQVPAQGGLPVGDHQPRARGQDSGSCAGEPLRPGRRPVLDHVERLRAGARESGHQAPCPARVVGPGRQDVLVQVRGERPKPGLQQIAVPRGLRAGLLRWSLGSHGRQAVEDDVELLVGPGVGDPVRPARRVGGQHAFVHAERDLLGPVLAHAVGERGPAPVPAQRRVHLGDHRLAGPFRRQEHVGERPGLLEPAAESAHRMGSGDLLERRDGGLEAPGPLCQEPAGDAAGLLAA